MAHEDAAGTGSEPLDGLLTMIRAGDQGAVAALYSEIHLPLLAYCQTALGSGSAAEDAVQDILVMIWQRASAFDADADEAAAFVGAVAREAVSSRLPGNRQASEPDWLEIQGSGSGNHIPPERDLLPGILRAVAELPQQRGEAANSSLGIDARHPVPLPRRRLARFGPLVALLAAAILIAGVHYWRTGDVRPSMVATLAGDAEIRVEWYESQRIIVVAIPADVDTGNSVSQLWLMQSGGSPMSLGIPGTDGALLEVSGEVASLLKEGAMLVVSREARRRPQTSEPSGPVIATGRLLLPTSE